MKTDFCFALLWSVLLVSVMGCGGHEGGVIEIPPGENPYQLTEQEQQAMNASVDETEGLEQELEAEEQASGDSPDDDATGEQPAPDQPQP